MQTNDFMSIDGLPSINEEKYQALIDAMFPMSDIDGFDENGNSTTPDDIWAHDSGDTRQDNGVRINGVEYTDEELARMYHDDIDAERAAEARMGGDNHYYPESHEEAEQRFVESLPPRNYAQFPTPSYNEYIKERYFPHWKD